MCLHPSGSFDPVSFCWSVDENIGKLKPPENSNNLIKIGVPCNMMSFLQHIVVGLLSSVNGRDSPSLLVYFFLVPIEDGCVKLRMIGVKIYSISQH